MRSRRAALGFVVLAVACVPKPPPMAPSVVPASVAARPVPAASAAPAVHPCPPDTAWDGVVCAHARATCGGWDGVTCAAPTATERAAAVEFEAIEDDARAACRDDEAPRDTDVVGDVLRKVDAALGRADRVNERLAQLREAHPSPRWEFATVALAGQVYDCIWTHLRAVQPVYFTPQQQAILNKLQGVAQPPQGPLLPATWTHPPTASLQGRASTVQAQIDDTKAQVREKWREQKDRYLNIIAGDVLRAYVPAILLARRYAFEAFDVTGARARVAEVVSTVGIEAAHGFVRDVRDPADPGRRSAAAALDALLGAP